jgi:hypothetical protein
MIIENASPSVVTPQASTGLDAWRAAVTAIVARYGPGGTFAQLHPGFPGLSAYEIWNEPNNPSGSGQPDCQTCEMDPATMDQILATASAAIRQQASQMGFTPDVMGPAVGALDLNYLGDMYASDHSVLGYVDSLSTHLYMNQDPATCSTVKWPAAGHCVRTLATLREWIDSHTPAGSSPPSIAITEGGYSGSSSSCRPPNVMSLADQAQYGVSAIDWIRSHPELDVDLFSPFQVVDNETVTYACGTGYDPDFYVESLGATDHYGALRPWGTAYEALVAEARNTPYLTSSDPVVDRSVDGTGDVIVGHAVALPDITLSNDGQASLPMTGLSLTGGASRDYFITTSCGSSLPAGQSCVITPTLRPSRPGARLASLVISLAAVPSSFTIPLSGTGVQGSLQFAPASLVFPATMRYGTSAALSTTVTNVGNAPATLTSISLDGANAPMFATWNTCPSVLAVGQTCLARITFTPSMTGPKTAKLTFRGDVPSGSQSVFLSGSTP